MAVRSILILGAVGAMLSLLWYLYPRGRVLDDHMGMDSLWHPNAEEILREVGAGPTGSFDDDRHSKFCQMFKKRYRDNNQAIGVKFITPDRIKAMFAPVIPRWDMARVAVELYKEARTVFGRDYEVDVYETYITAPMRKLAEVRADPNDPRAQVTFNPRFASERPADLIRINRSALKPAIPGLFWPSDVGQELRRIDQRSLIPLPRPGSLRLPRAASPL